MQRFKRRARRYPPSPVYFPTTRGARVIGGSLKTTLHARIADNMLVDQFSGEQRVVHTPTLEGTIPGPTLSLQPGDTFRLIWLMTCRANPKVQRAGFFPHDPYTVNLHTHGLSVSPLGISDNIYREMKPGTTNHIQIDIPADHPSGTYWYHPHKHGAVTFQLISGMAGFLIIRGGPGTLDAVPEVAAARDVVMGFQVIRTATGWQCTIRSSGSATVRHLSLFYGGSAPARNLEHLWIGRRSGAELLLLHD